MSLSSLFGSKTPKTINNVPVTQSSQGYPIPAIMGQAKTHTSLMFLGAMQEQKQPGAKGGGKGGNYLYYAPVVAALCNGEVVSIGHMWANGTWLSAQGTNEQITVVSHYSPANAALLIADNGVTLANTYSATYTDYGQPASTVLSGTDGAPMQLVPYNYSLSPAANSAALTTGQYSVSLASIGTFTLTAVANASGGSTVYTGTFTSPTGASNGFAGFRFSITGFTHAANNGNFLCTASSTTSITLSNAGGVAETHGGFAQDMGNTYHFSSADAGKSAAVWYQFNYSQLMQQDIAVVPSSSVIGGSTVPYAVQVSNQYTPTANVNVQYYGEGNPNAGVTLTQVSGTPTTAGTYKFFGAVSIGGSYYTYYQFSAADLGNEIMMTWGYTNQSAVGQNAPELINFELFGGGQGQAEWPFLVDGGTWQLGGSGSNSASGTMPGSPGQALGYTGIAYVGYGPMFLGASGQIQDNTFEVLTPDAYGGGITDCNPVQCIYQVLTNKMWGLGSGTNPFPTSAIDNSSAGTWGGAAGTPGSRQVGSTAWNWFAANNFFISPKIDSQQSAASVISEWLEAGMCAAFMSEGLLKLVPYGSTSVAANGCTWVGPQNYVVALDDTCFIAKEGEDPIKINRSAWQDAVNWVQVGFSNRANQYEGDVCQEWDQAAINRFGLRREDVKSWSFIRALTSAVFAASMRVKRATSIRNTYSGVLPFTYSYLEPMDIVTITTSSTWAAGLNNANLGITNLPVRVKKIVDDPTKGLSCTFEDYQALAQQPVLFNKGISGGSVPANAWAQPGNSEVVMFEATSRLTQQKGNQVWIGACGALSTWGGCNIYVSQDGSNYEQVGTINSAARLGVLANSLPSGGDPDTSHTMVANLAENSAPLNAGSTTDADLNNTLCFVDGELIAYSTCVLSGDNQYSMGTYLRRGQMGSAVSSHSAGGLFLRLDNNVFQYTYDPTWAGETLYFKFQSFNTFENNPQLLSSLTAVTFTVPGLNPGTIDASSGIVLNTPANTVGAGPLGWAFLSSGGVAATVNYGNYGYSGMNSSVPGVGVNGQYFYSRFLGYLVPSVTGEYTLGLNFDDGASLYIGGQQVGTGGLVSSGAMAASGSYRTSAQIMLTAGVPYPIVIEWQQGTSNYGLQLLWTLPKASTATVVPASNLSQSASSVTGSLNLSVWQGTAGLYYPTGNGLIDPGNKTLYGPPNNGGGIAVVAAVTTVSGTPASPAISSNSFLAPGWITGQAYSAAGIVDIFLPTGSATTGYMFRVDFRSGAVIGYILKASNSATSTWTVIGTNYLSANSSAITGWFNFAIYVSTSGYMSLWINNVLSCDVTDTAYPQTGTDQIRYWYEINTTGKLSPPPNAPGAGSSGLTQQGSIIPNQPLNDPTYASSTTSITLSWSSQTMLLSDGSTVTIASGSKTYSGLSASTTYYFYPYVQVSTLTVQFANGSPPPTSANATYAAQANSDGCYSLNPFTASTTASGTGGGGGNIHCPEASELVDVQGKGNTPVREVKAGDYIRGFSFHSNADVYRKVISTAIAPASAWRVIEGHKVTPCEPIWNGKAFAPAYQVPGSSLVINPSAKVMIHVDSDEYDECNYWLVGDKPLLTHNSVPS